MDYSQESSSRFKSVSALVGDVYGAHHTISFLTTTCNEKASFYKDAATTYRALRFIKSPHNRHIFIGVVIFGFLGMIVRMGMQVYILSNIVTDGDGAIFDGALNRRYASISLDLTIFITMCDFLFRDSEGFAHRLDHTLTKSRFSFDDQAAVEVQKGKKRVYTQIIIYVICQTLMSLFTIRKLLLTTSGWLLYVNLATRILVYLILGYFFLFLYRLSILSLYIRLGFEFISWKLERRSEEKALDVELIRDCRNHYEELADRIKEFNQTHSLMINGLILTVILRIITSVYDAFLSGWSFKFFRILQIGISLFRLSIVLSAVCVMHEAAGTPRKFLQDITLMENNASLLLEVYLFLDRIKNSKIGFKLLNQFIIDRSIAPTILTIVITYFVAVASLNRGHEA